MKSKVHTYTSVEPMLHVNAFIVETNDSLVIVDTTLTMTDSKNLKKKADGLAKPIAGIILTHAHPDHVAGTLNIAPNGDVPIYSLASVKKLMEETEQQKHQQWSGMFGAEWVPKWIYPNKIVAGGESVDIGGLKFQGIDLGSGGDCDANSLWLMEEERIGFLGDFIYNKNHTYMADGSVLRWVSNLERLSDQLKNYSSFYIGHGDSCDFSGLEKQKDYLLTYCSELLKATNGSAEFTEQTRKQFESKMFSKFPDYDCQFMVGLAADRVAEELKSLSH